MKERPILFSGPMVKAILEDRKTQTRRVLTPQPDASWMVGVDWSQYYKDGKKHLWIPHPEDVHKEIIYRYGQPGDRLWVREACAYFDASTAATDRDALFYRADGQGKYFSPHPRRQLRGNPKLPKASLDGMWKPSIFMPRWASRITLEITGVRVERLQDITADDCDAEGVGGFYPHLPNCSHPPVTEVGQDCHCSGSSLPEIFHAAWDVLNAKRGFGWDVNPWVWVIEFRRVN